MGLEKQLMPKERKKKLRVKYEKYENASESIR